MIENFWFFVSFIITLLIFVAYVYYTYTQWKEVIEPQDNLTIIRWIILGIFLITLVTLAPVVFYQYLVAIGHDSKTLRNVITIDSRIGSIATTVLVGLIIRSKIKR